MVPTTSMSGPMTKTLMVSSVKQSRKMVTTEETAEARSDGTVPVKKARRGVAPLMRAASSKDVPSPRKVTVNGRKDSAAYLSTYANSKSQAVPPKRMVMRSFSATTICTGREKLESNASANTDPGKT